MKAFRPSAMGDPREPLPLPKPSANVPPLSERDVETLACAYREFLRTLWQLVRTGHTGKKRL